MKNSDFRALVGLEILSMTYVEKISIYYYTMNCVKRLVATEPERIYGDGKDSSFLLD